MLFRSGSVGRGGPAEGMSFRVYAEANDPQLGPTMWGSTTRRALGGSPADRRPQVAPTSSAQAADHSLPRKRESSFPPLGLLLPTPTTSLGRRGGPIGCAGSSRPTGPVVAGANGRRAGSRPTDGAPAAQASGNPSSAPVRALGHLPPSGGKAPGARCAPPGDTPVSEQKSAPPGIRAALVFTALRGNTPNQGWQAAACRGCCAGR